jgi:hypothetical protein
VARWLILGPYPPERGAGARAAAAFAAQRLRAGDDVVVVSPRPTAAHDHAPLEGPAGIRLAWSRARSVGADGLWVRVEHGILLRRGVSRPVALRDRVLLRLLMRSVGGVVLDVGDTGLMPGGRAGAIVTGGASRLVVHDDGALANLLANGVPRERIDLEPLDPEPTADAPRRPAVPPAAAARRGPLPPPEGLRDLSPDRSAIEAAVRARVSEVRGA